MSVYANTLQNLNFDLKKNNISKHLILDINCNLKCLKNIKIF